MKKTLLFFIACVLASSLLNAQNQGGPKNLTGSSIVGSSQYIPGTTVDLFFNINFMSIDGEWADSVSLSFPYGITVNSATSPLPGLGQPMNPIVNGSIVSWGHNINDAAAPASKLVPQGNAFVAPDSNSFTCNAITSLCSHYGCGGSYANNANGYTVIYPVGTNSIHISGSFDLEGNFDYLRIYRGIGVSGSPDVSYSGQGGTIADFVGDPGLPVTVQFTSDGSVTYSGFSLLVSPANLNFSVNVTIDPTITGNQIIPWAISGNNFGGEMHNVSGNITIQRTAMQIAFTPVQPSACGVADGSISVSVLNGIEPYLYSWKNMAGAIISTSSSVNNLDVGIYRLIVTDNTGFTDSSEVEFNNTNGPVISIALCNFTNVGILTASATGVGPFSYLWNSGSTSSANTISSIGNYSVIVTDDISACKSVKSFSVTEFLTELTATINKTDRPCNYSTDGGRVWVDVIGGKPDYAYNWSNSGGLNYENTIPVIGENTVTITDANGCEIIKTINVDLPPAIQIARTDTNPRCNGDKNGSISLIASGGVGTHYYLWSNDSISPNNSGLAQGSYIVTVSDDNGCSLKDTTVLTDPQLLTATTTGTDATCGSNDGTVSAAASGGTLPYSYSWSYPLQSTNASVTGVSVGSYIVTVTDANNCQATSTIIVNSIGGPTFSIATVNPNCTDSMNGKAWVVNGLPSYTYAWSAGVVQYPDTVKKLAKGTYMVTVTDATCSTIQPFTLIDPSLSFQKVNPLCQPHSSQNNATGSITVNTSGLTPPYTYSWNGSSSGYEQVLMNAPVGSYQISVVDSTGCIMLGTTDLTAPPAPVMSFGTITEPLCNGYSDGSIIINFTGGSTPLTYAWFNSYNSSINGTTKDIVNATAGSYNYTCNDSLGCSYYYTSVTLYEPGPVQGYVSSNNTSCGQYTGSVEIGFDGGIGPQTWVWNTGSADPIVYNLGVGIYSVIITDGNGCIGRDSVTVVSLPMNFGVNTTDATCFGGSNGGATLIENGGAPFKMLYNFQWSNGESGFHATSLTAGNHSVTITNGANCSDIMYVSINQPDEIMIAYDSSNVTCNGLNNGWIDIYDVWGGNVSGNGTNGGKKWNTGSVLNNQTQPKFMNSYGFEWFQNEISMDIYDSYLDNVVAGNYTVKITDDAGCIKPFNFTITQPQLTYSAEIIPVSCKGMGNGKIIINATTEVDSLAYSIDGINLQTSNVFDSLNTGTYEIYTQVYGANSCQQLQDTVVITEPDSITATVSSSPVLCHGGSSGSITITGAGGNTPYGYSINGGTPQEMPLFNGLQAGNYSVAITDSKGCIYNLTGGATVTEIPTLSAVLTSVPVTCFGESNGSISLVASGGSGSYNYLWSNDSTGSTVTGLAAATYSVVVEDANNCIVVKTKTVTEPSLLVVNASGTNVLCSGGNDGSANAVSSGGNGMHSYSWSANANNAQNQGVTGLVAGVYSVVVTDVNNCKDSGSVVITEPLALTGSITAQSDILCNGLNTGSVSVIGAGGTQSYTYSIDGGTYNANGTFADLSAGTHAVSVKDANSCNIVVPIEITQPTDAVSGSITSQNNILCYGLNTGSVTVLGTGGTLGLTYSTDGISFYTSGTFNALSTGMYNVIVKDTFGCTKTVPVDILQPAAALSANIVSQTNVLCNAASTGVFSVAGFGGTSGYSYSIDGTTYQMSGTFANMAAGNYTVTVKDTNACSVIVPVTLSEPTALAGSVITQTNILCYGVGTASATVSGSGGISGYTYSADGTTYQANGSFTGLLAGSNSLYVKDANGCVANVNVDIIQPSAALSGSIFAQTNVTCFGLNTGSVTVTGAGGTGGYTYAMNGVYQTSGTFLNLLAGVYGVSVKDANGCTVLVTVTISQSGAALTGNISAQTNVLCNGSNTGSVTVTGAGGTSSYTYSIDGGSFLSNGSFTGLFAGTHAVTVKDANNCTTVGEVIISEPTAVTVNVMGMNTLCTGSSNGSAVAVAAGGVGTYSYLWSSSTVTTSMISGLVAGTYTVTVKDNNNCSTTGSVVITEPSMLTISTSSTISACNLCTGTATTDAIGGTQPYAYSWSNQLNTPMIENLCAQNYWVTVTDANGCMKSTSVIVTAQSLSSVSGEAHWTGGNLPNNSATVEMYKIIDLTQAELAYSMPLVNSQFLFNNVAYGNYFVKVNIINGTGLPHVMSTYLDSTTLWVMADTIPVACQTTVSLHIPMFITTPPAGQTLGSISGYITYADYGSGKGVSSYDGPKLAGEPVPGAEIYVELEPDDQPIANTTTDEEGFYIVPGLTSGESYTLNVDIPGLPMISTYSHVSIDSDTNTYTQMNFYVDTSSTNGGIFVDTSANSVIKFENDKFNLSMYPNPFSELLNIQYKLNKTGYVQLYIYDIAGKIVATLVNENQNSGDFIYTFNAYEYLLSEGNYIVKLQVNNSVYIKKIIRIK